MSPRKQWGGGNSSKVTLKALKIFYEYECSLAYYGWYTLLTYKATDDTYTIFNNLIH